MSVNGLQQQYIPPTLDGLNVIDADQIYIDGELVDLDNLVPYTGATKILDMGSLPVRSSAVPTTGNDLINFTELVNAITNQDITNSTTFLNKITATPQTVQASTTFLSGLTTSNERPAILGSRVVVDANYQSALTSADVSVGQYFGTITSSGSTYQATSTGSPPILVLFPITAGKRYNLTIEVLGDDSTYDTTLDIYQSDNGVNPYPNFNDAVLDSPLFAPASTVFHQTNATFVATTTGSVIINLTTNDPSGISTVKWKNMYVYEMGVALTNASLPTQLADRVAVINDKKQLVSSGISTTKLGYLDNVSSDIQTQLNARVPYTGATQALDMGVYKVTSTYVPTAGPDLINKTYGDANYVSSAVLTGYVLKTGDTMTGSLSVLDTVNIDIAGLTPATTPCLNLTSTGNHYNGSASQTYLFNAPSGEIQLSYSTTRNATTATLLLGAPSTDISEIVSVSGDGTTPLPMNFLASLYSFLTGNVGIGTTDPRDRLHVQKNNGYASRAANPLPSNIIASSASQRLYMGSYYTGGAGACSTIQSSDYYTDGGVPLDHGAALLLNPIGGFVSIGKTYNGAYYDANCKLTVNSDYAGGDTGGFCINATDNGGAPNSYNLRLYPFVQAGGQVAYQFKTYNQSSPYDAFKILYNGDVQFDNLVYVNNGDLSKTIYGPNASWGAYLEVGAGTNAISSIRAQVLSTNGNLHLDAAVGKDMYCGYYANAGGGANAHRFIGSAYMSGKLTLGTESFDQGILNIRNPNGSFSHFGWTDNWNYIRGVATQIDTANVYANSIFNIYSGTRYAVIGGHMAQGSLTLGGSDRNYGGGSGWNGNMAGLFFECQTQTEIAVHDGGNRVASLMYFVGDAANTITIGRDMGWGTTQVLVPSSLSCGGYFQVGTGNAWMKMGVKGGTISGDIYTTANWPQNHNGILISQDANQGPNTSGMCLGYGTLNSQTGVITCLAPSVAWRNMYISCLAVYLLNNGVTVAYTTAGGWVNISDEREKDDIQDIKTSSSLKRVLALKPKHYRRKYYETGTPVPEEVKTQRVIGFSAQEVKDSNPHCVSEWENDQVKCEEDDGKRLGICYNDYVVHLVGAVQEQQKMIKDLQQQVEAQRQEFAEYKRLTEERFDKIAQLLSTLK
jgi:hypothetical protein